MEQTLNTCIDAYIEQAPPPRDIKTAQHLKSVIPMTKHLETSTFSHFNDALLQENTKTDFKDAFLTVSPRFVLKGNIINRESFTKRFPTFIDAGWWDKFYPARENDRYGRTKCLDGSSQGMPEIVHPNLRIPEVLETVEVLENRQWS